MVSGQRVANWFKEKVWKYVKVASVAGGMIFGLSPFFFSVERLLLKSRIHFGLFIPKDEKFQDDGKFKETSSSVQLREILSPEAGPISYYMITGEPGIGKSSASTHNADVLDHKGIVYVKVPSSGDPKEFEESLARRLFLYHLVYDKFFSYLSLYGVVFLDFPSYDGNQKRSYLTIMMDKLCVLSHQYKRRHDGKGLVLVIDNVNNFLTAGEYGRYYLDVLQNTAKYLADTSQIKIVFVSSEGEAFARMVNPRAISRAHVIEFQEATDEEALDFLKDRLGEDEFNKKQNDLVDIVQNYTGGRFRTLADVVKAKDNLTGLCRFSFLLNLSLLVSTLGKKGKLRDDAEKLLRSFDMHREKEELEKEMDNEKQKEGERRKAKQALVMKKIGDYIEKHGRIDRGLATRMLLGTMGEEELRRTNVFAYHHSGDFYSFSTRALKTVYKERCLY